MNIQSYDVLVVDDSIDQARECAELIRNRCGLSTTFATNAEKAIEIIKKHPIKVAVLDQVMAPISGTELFDMVRKFDDNIRMVLYSIQGTSADFAKAQQQGFDALLVKTDWEKLPDTILSLCMKYSTMMSAVSGSVLLVDSKGRFKKYSITYTMLHYTVLDAEFTYENKWITRQMIEAGEKVTLEKNIDYEKEFTFSDNFAFKADFTSEMSSEKFLTLKTGLSSQLEEQIQSKYSERIKVAINRIRELTLPETSGQSPKIVSRCYECAQVFLQIKAYIKKSFTCCGEDSIYATTVYFPVPRVKYRFVEYYEKGSPATIDSGICGAGYGA